MTETYYSAARGLPEPHLPLGWQVMAYDSLDSTNTALRRLVEQGAELGEGVLVWAKEQTAGRGRAGRTWKGAPGNVYVSYLVGAPENSAEAPQLGLLAALAVADCILELPRHNAAPPGVSCKWPNDVLVEGAKACGILPELVDSPAGVTWLVLGIGINLQPVDVLDPTYPITSLSEHHIDTTAAHVLTVLSRMLHAWIATWRAQGFDAIRAAWLKRGPRVGSDISVNPGNGLITGTFAGMDRDGALLLDTASGQKRILAGDVLLAGES